MGVRYDIFWRGEFCSRKGLLAMVTQSSIRVLPPSLQPGILRLRYELRRRLAEFPAVYLPYTTFRRRSASKPGVPLTDGTEIVIEGFPRSANSFAVFAFGMAQGRTVRIARHLHAPAQIIEAARRNIPCLVLMRDPEGTVLSNVIRTPYLSIKQILRAYVSFYSCILPYRNHYVLGLYNDVVIDFGSIIEKINRKFGTDFEVFVHSESNVQKCFELIEERNRENYGRGKVIEDLVARPSNERKEKKKGLLTMFHADHLRDIRERAYEICKLFTPD